MSKISEKTCPEFISALASKEPVPGGGGAAALCGAVGTALGNMVGSLTAGKKKYADVEEEIISLKEKCDKLQADLLDLIDKDAMAFEPLSKAYSLPKNTPKEIAYKEEVMEECLKEACAVPLKIMEKICKAIDIIDVFAKKGSVIAVSDAGCAAAVCKGALYAASLNVFVNTKDMKDKECAEGLNGKAEAMLKEYGEKAGKIFYEVKDRFK